MESEPTHHANALCINGIGLLIRGASGSGKSRLTLTMLKKYGASFQKEAGPPTQDKTALIADDRVGLTNQNNGLLARPAKALEGLIEARGMGIVGCGYRPSSTLHGVVDIVDLNQMERLPDSLSTVVDSVQMPCLKVPKGDLLHQVTMIEIALDCGHFQS